MFTVQQFANTSQLPTLPEIAMQLVEIAYQDNPDFREVSRIVRSDPVISGKILKLTNSALFGFRHRVDTIEQAIPKLGITLLRTLVLSFHLSSHKTRQDELGPVFQRHWRSSLTQAVLAELIAEKIEGVDAPTCFLGAMLQDIGILAMLSEAPVEYMDQVLSRADFPNVDAAERSHFGFSHTHVSVEIMKKWGLDESFGSAIQHHHDRMSASTPMRKQKLKAILQAANLGTAVLFSTHTSAMSLDFSLDQWVGFMKTHFGMSVFQTEELMSEVNQRVEEYSILFKFSIGERVQADRVVARAKDLLQEIALKNQIQLMSKNAGGKRRVDDDELYQDSLSGLYNRRFLDEKLSNQLTASFRKQQPIALMFLDVDKFKKINDTYGHAAGDKAIRHVATWLVDSIRKNDLAIRLGGDEFLVILKTVNERHFEKIAMRIAKEVPPLMLADGESVEISLSLGCTIYQPAAGDPADLNWLIDQADKSMYQVKKSGGDSVSIQRFVGSSQAGTIIAPTSSNAPMSS